MRWSAKSFARSAVTSGGIHISGSPEALVVRAIMILLSERVDHAFAGWGRPFLLSLVGYAVSVWALAAARAYRRMYAALLTPATMAATLSAASSTRWSRTTTRASSGSSIGGRPGPRFAVVLFVLVMGSFPNGVRAYLAAKYFIGMLNARL